MQCTCTCGSTCVGTQVPRLVSWYLPGWALHGPKLSRQTILFHMASVYNTQSDSIADHLSVSSSLSSSLFFALVPCHVQLVVISFRTPVLLLSHSRLSVSSASGGRTHHLRRVRENKERGRAGEQLCQTRTGFQTTGSRSVNQKSPKSHIAASALCLRWIRPSYLAANDLAPPSLPPLTSPRSRLQPGSRSRTTSLKFRLISAL